MNKDEIILSLAIFSIVFLFVAIFINYSQPVFEEVQNGVVYQSTHENPANYFKSQVISLEKARIVVELNKSGEQNQAMVQGLVWFSYVFGALDKEPLITALELEESQIVSCAGDFNSSCELAVESNKGEFLIYIVQPTCEQPMVRIEENKATVCADVYSNVEPMSYSVSKMLFPNIDLLSNNMGKILDRV